jgi:hypothetical protein
MAEEPIKLFATRAERYPEHDNADTALGVVKAALAAIPIVGGPINELLSMVLAPAVTRRRDEWLKELAYAFEELKGKVGGFKVESLVNDEVFVSAIIHATHIAIRTHQQEKREMLRNALLNIAVGNGPSEELQQIYLDAIDAFTLSHVKVLRVLWTGLSDLNRPCHCDALHPHAISDYATAIGCVHPELKGQDDLLQCVMADLLNRGFSTVARPSDAFSQAPGVTNMGIGFLRFVLEQRK